MLTLGGMGYAQEYHVERYLRESLDPEDCAGQPAPDPELPGREGPELPKSSDSAARPSEETQQ